MVFFQNQTNNYKNLGKPLFDKTSLETSFEKPVHLASRGKTYLKKSSKNATSLSEQKPSFISSAKGRALEILLQPEIITNKFSDYTVKERTLNLFREEKQSITDFTNFPIKIFFNNKIQSKSLTRNLFQIINNWTNLGRTTMVYPEQSISATEDISSLSMIFGKNHRKITRRHTKPLKKKDFSNSTIGEPYIFSTEQNGHLENVTLDWLKQWYHFTIKPFSTKYKIYSLNQFHFPKYSSDVTYLKNLGLSQEFSNRPNQLSIDKVYHSPSQETNQNRKTLANKKDHSLAIPSFLKFSSIINMNSHMIDRFIIKKKNVEFHSSSNSEWKYEMIPEKHIPRIDLYDDVENSLINKGTFTMFIYEPLKHFSITTTKIYNAEWAPLKMTVSSFSKRNGWLFVSNNSIKNGINVNHFFFGRLDNAQITPTGEIVQKKGLLPKQLDTYNRSAYDGQVLNFTNKAPIDFFLRHGFTKLAPKNYSVKPFPKKQTSRNSINWVATSERHSIYGMPFASNLANENLHLWKSVEKQNENNFHEKSRESQIFETHQNKKSVEVPLISPFYRSASNRTKTQNRHNLTFASIPSNNKSFSDIPPINSVLFLRVPLSANSKETNGANLNKQDYFSQLFFRKIEEKAEIHSQEDSFEAHSLGSPQAKLQVEPQTQIFAENQQILTNPKKESFPEWSHRWTIIEQRDKNPSIYKNESKQTIKKIKTFPIAFIRNESIIGSELLLNKSKTNEVGIYSLANYFASSEFSKKAKQTPINNLISPISNFFGLQTSKSFDQLSKAKKNKLGFNKLKPGIEKPVHKTRQQTSLRFYEGNNLMPLKFNDAFKFNFKNMNIYFESTLENQQNEKKIETLKTLKNLIFSSEFSVFQGQNLKNSLASPRILQTDGSSSTSLDHTPFDSESSNWKTRVSTTSWWDPSQKSELEKLRPSVSKEQPRQNLEKREEWESRKFTDWQESNKDKPVKALQSSPKGTILPDSIKSRYSDSQFGVLKQEINHVPKKKSSFFFSSLRKFPYEFMTEIPLYIPKNISVGSNQFSWGSPRVFTRSLPTSETLQNGIHLNGTAATSDWMFHSFFGKSLQQETFSENFLPSVSQKNSYDKNKSKNQINSLSAFYPSTSPDWKREATFTPYGINEINNSIFDKFNFQNLNTQKFQFFRAVPQNFGQHIQNKSMINFSGQKSPQFFGSEGKPQNLFRSINFSFLGKAPFSESSIKTNGKSPKTNQWTLTYIMPRNLYNTQIMQKFKSHLMFSGFSFIPWKNLSVSQDLVQVFSPSDSYFSNSFAASSTNLIQKKFHRIPSVFFSKASKIFQFFGTGKKEFGKSIEKGLEKQIVEKSNRATDLYETNSESEIQNTSHNLKPHLSMDKSQANVFFKSYPKVNSFFPKEKSLNKKINNLFYNSNFNVSILKNYSNFFTSPLVNSLLNTRVLLSNQQDPSSSSNNQNLQDNNSDNTKSFVRAPKNFQFFENDKNELLEKNKFVAESDQFKQLIENIYDQETRVSPSKGSVKKTRRISKQQSQKIEIENKKKPKILIKSKKLKPMFSDISTINSISFLQYFTFPFGPKVSTNKNTAKALYNPLQEQNPLRSDLPFKESRERSEKSQSFNSDINRNVVTNNFNTNSSLFQQLPNLQDNACELSIEKMISFKKNKQDINKKILKEFLKYELPKLSVYYQKPTEKKKKEKKKKKKFI